MVADGGEVKALSPCRPARREPLPGRCPAASALSARRLDGGDQATGDPHHRGDQQLARAVGPLQPPQGESVQRAADRLAERLQFGFGDAGRELAQQRHVRLPLPPLHLAVEGRHLLVAGGVAEHHAPGVRMALHVPEPGVVHRRHARGQIALAIEEFMDRGGGQLVAVPLQQGEVQLLLGVEVAVEHRLAQARFGGDLPDGGAREAALREQPGRGVLDTRPGLGARGAPPVDLPHALPPCDLACSGW